MATIAMHALRRTEPFSLTPRVLQFGAGNFVRAFVDWQLDLLNERSGLDAGVVVVRPTSWSTRPLLDVQDGLFTTLLQGLNDLGEPEREVRVVRCVQRELQLERHYDEYLALAHLPTLRFVVSNTTEAGIAVNDRDGFVDRPSIGFPAKLTRWLFERYRAFDGSARHGVYVLPCELIEDNGPALRRAVGQVTQLWKLEGGFDTWLDEHCHFCSTLVDRIVMGRPDVDASQLEAELGYSDRFLVAAEPFYLWVIQEVDDLARELGLAGAGLNIRLVEDVRPWRLRKVGLLNGGHTCLAPVALLAGVGSVGEAMTDPQLGAFLAATLQHEIAPSLDLPRVELESFADAVLRRFANPFIRHRLASIAFNSWSKFAVRVMPQLLRYHDLYGGWPKRLVLALAATMHLYRGEVIALADDPAHIEWMRRAWARHDEKQDDLETLARTCLACASLWGRDLGRFEGLTAALAQALELIATRGIRAAIDTTGGSTPTERR